MFSYTEIEGEQSAIILHGFMERVADHAAIGGHAPRHLSYDPDATLTYEGDLTSWTGVSMALFHVHKPGTFLIAIYVPPVTEPYFPKIKIWGDESVASTFLVAFQMAEGEWVQDQP